MKKKFTIFTILLISLVSLAGRTSKTTAEKYAKTEETVKGNILDEDTAYFYRGELVVSLSPYNMDFYDIYTYSKYGYTHHVLNPVYISLYTQRDENGEIYTYDNAKERIDNSNFTTDVQYNIKKKWVKLLLIQQRLVLQPLVTKLEIYSDKLKSRKYENI